MGLWCMALGWAISHRIRSQPTASASGIIVMLAFCSSLLVTTSCLMSVNSLIIHDFFGLVSESTVHVLAVIHRRSSISSHLGLEL